MKINYTPSQKKAIDTRDKALLLSAAAGSGKTAVLVARILEIIGDESNDINITDLLIVTFTNLAASQMKERIYKEVTSRIKENPKNKKLKKQLIYLPGAKIKTIHSFCLDIIKENIDSLDIPVNFRVMDEDEENTMKLSVLNEFTEEKYKEYDAKFLDIMNTYAYGRDDSEFVNLMLWLDKYIDSMPDKNGYIQMCCDNLKDAGKCFGKSIYGNILLQHIKLILKDAIRKYDIAIEKGNMSPDFDQYPPFFETEKKFLETLFDKDDISEISALAEEFKFPTIPRKKRGTDSAFFKGIRDEVKLKSFENIKSALEGSIENEEKSQRQILSHFENLMELLCEYKEALQEEKIKRAVLTFSDFEHLAYKLLQNEDGTPSSIALSIKNSFYEILIDEYQDTSEIQNRIFECISKDGKNLFMVGDVKQSIYKFRHAKPELFIKKAKDFEDFTDDACLIRLKENFRSRSQVVDSVNKIFIDIMTEETSKTDYKEEMLVCGSNTPEDSNTDYKTEVLLFSNKNSDDDDETGSNEGDMIAKRIGELIQSEFKIYDSKSNGHRNINYGDIVILVRDMGDKSKRIYNSLLQNDIPVSAEFEGGFYARPEILSIINILSAIDNPYNDLSFISLLKSPAFHFTEEELFMLRMENENVPFYELLKASENENAKKVVEFIDEFQNKAVLMNLSDFISEVCSYLDLYERFSTFSGFEQRIYHLDVFFNIACQYEKNSEGSLKGFLYYLEKAEANPKKVKNIYENKNENSVKILTMHKSKGLEFPVVFVSGMGKSLKGKDKGQKIIMHPEIGVGADYISEEEMYITKTMCKNAVKISCDYEQISEELRVLYVALTRAKEKLILTAKVNVTAEKQEFWNTVKETGGYSLTSLLQNARFIDWVMPSVIDSKLFLVKIFEEITKIEIEDLEKEAVLPEVIDEIFYEYPDNDKTKLPLKITVSRANKLSYEEKPYSGKFNLVELDSSFDKVSGSEYGTYFHKMFELCDIDAIKNGESVKDVLDKIFDKGLVEKTDYSSEIVGAIESFFNTDLGKELLSSEAVYKETPFLVRVPANEIYDTKCTDFVLLQGATDCYFKTDKGIVLLDFKTDKNPNPEKIKENYKKQIELYAYALEKVTELKVYRKLIYTVRNASIIEI